MQANIKHFKLKDRFELMRSEGQICGLCSIIIIAVTQSMFVYCMNEFSFLFLCALNVWTFSHGCPMVETESLRMFLSPTLTSFRFRPLTNINFHSYLPSNSIVHRDQAPGRSNRRCCCCCWCCCVSKLS